MTLSSLWIWNDWKCMTWSRTASLCKTPRSGASSDPMTDTDLRSNGMKNGIFWTSSLKTMTVLPLICDHFALWSWSASSCRVYVFWPSSCAWLSSSLSSAAAAGWTSSSCGLTSALGSGTTRSRFCRPICLKSARSACSEERRVKPKGTESNVTSFVNAEQPPVPFAPSLQAGRLIGLRFFHLFLPVWRRFTVAALFHRGRARLGTGGGVIALRDK